LANVLEALGRVAAELFDLCHATAERAAVGVDQVRDLDAGDFRELIDVIAAAAADAGHADAHGVVGAQHPAGRLGAGDDKRSGDAGRRRLTKELPSRKTCHGWVSWRGWFAEAPNWLRSSVS